MGNQAVVLTIHYPDSDVAICVTLAEDGGEVADNLNADLARGAWVDWQKSELKRNRRRIAQAFARGLRVEAILYEPFDKEVA